MPTEHRSRFAAWRRGRPRRSVQARRAARRRPIRWRPAAPAAGAIRRARRRPPARAPAPWRRAGWRTSPGAWAAPASALHRRDRIALVGHRRRTAGRALAHLGHLVLGQQGDVAGHLAGHAGRLAERAGELGDRGPDRCATAGRGSARPELGRRVRRATSAPGPPSPASVPAAPPNWTASRGPDRGQPGGACVEADHPAGRLEPERGRQRLLQQRPAGHRACPGARGPGRRRRRRRRAGRPAAGRAPAGPPASRPCRGCPGWSLPCGHTRPNSGGHGRAQALDQWHHRIAVRGRGRRQVDGTSSRTVAQASAIARPRPRPGSTPGPRRGPGQRRLDLEQRGEPGAHRLTAVAHRAAGEHAVEETRRCGGLSVPRTSDARRPSHPLPAADVEAGTRRRRAHGDQRSPARRRRRRRPAPGRPRSRRPRRRSRPG